VREVGCRRDTQQVGQRAAEDVGVEGRLGGFQRRPPQLGGKRRAAEQDLLPGVVALGQPAAGAAVARVAQHPLQQLLGGLRRCQLVELLELLAGQHQARLELEQRRDEDEELGRRLQVELLAALEMVEVGDHHFGQFDFEQVELFAQDQRQQQVEGAREDVEVELEVLHAQGRHGRAR
jgi:hypothetical protein